MPVSIEILPWSPRLDMFGDPETSTVYSLSGQVSITLTSSTSLFDGPRTHRLRLQSLAITFEGQSELVDPAAGYSAVRLCEITRELAPIEPLLLSNEGQEDSAPCTWSFVFDLPIPGWLPPSTVFGSDAHGDAGTRYALFAKAQFATVDAGAWSLANLCMPFTPKTRVVEAREHVVSVTRYTRPCLPSPSDLCPQSTYAVKACVDNPDDDVDELRIPSDILSKVDVIVTLPDNIGLDEEHVPVTLRLRGQGLEPEHQSRLKLTDFYVELNQFEKYRTSPSESYSSKFPLPPASSQPPAQPLRSPHAMKALCDIGLVAAGSTAFESSDAFSLLPASQSGHYQLAGDGLIFAKPDEDELQRSWFKLDVTVPMTQFGVGNARDRAWEARHGRVKRVRPTGEDPLLTVRHEVHVLLQCAYDRSAEGLPALTDHLSFSLPLCFVCAPPPRTLGAEAAASVEAFVGPPALAPPHPYAAALPAYSQLFHPNGDRKIDYSIALPLYTPGRTSVDIQHENPSLDSDGLPEAKATDAERIPLPSSIEPANAS